MSLSHDLPTQPERAASPCCWRYRGGAPAPRGAQWESGTERPPAMTSGSADRGRQTPSWANSRCDRARGRVVSSVVFRGSRPDSAALAGGRIEQRGRSRARNGPSVARVGVGLGPGASSLPASPAPPNSPPNHLFLSSVQRSFLSIITTTFVMPHAEPEPAAADQPQPQPQRLPFPPVTYSHILHCSYHYWHPLYEDPPPATSRYHY